MEKIVWFYDFDRVFDQHDSRIKNIFLYFTGINKTYVQECSLLSNFTVETKRSETIFRK